MDFDFSGYATRNDLLCSDGRTIRKNAFIDNDGKEVPLVWNHQHNDPGDVLGHALLENRDDGVYAYCKFNDTESGKLAKKLVQHGDIRSLSIYANKLKQVGGDVIHGIIRELSLVHAGANSGAFIDQVMAHGDNSEDGMIIGYDENIMLYHSADEKEKEDNSLKKEEKTETKPDNSEKEKEKNTDKNFGEIVDSMTEEQRNAMYSLIAMAVEDAKNGEFDDDIDEKPNEQKEGGNEMKHNVFDNETKVENTLSHSDEAAIVELAKQSGVGSLQQAMQIYAEEASLQHDSLGDTEALFPEYETLNKGTLETITRDSDWVTAVIGKIHKSPISRIRTRQADARVKELKAHGYGKKGSYKTETAAIQLITRTTDPQSIYVKDDMHRDDLIDITDFDAVAYKWWLMNGILNETLAMAALVGDGRDVGDADKIHEDHIRPIWRDNDMYCIHSDVDFAAAKTKLQGTNTGANFSENYIKAEAIIEAALYAREKYKGSGTPDLFCTPHLLNVMLLARDLNGRRIYDSKSDLASALNVSEIYTAEQFEGLTRTTNDSKKKKLLGLFVNLSDYQFGATKGGEVTKFEDFDMDFNRYKYMLETRLSGALTKLYSAIALEEDVTNA